MQRACDECGTTYVAQRPTSRFCSTRCRTRQTRKRAAGIDTSKPTPRPVVMAPSGGRLAEATRAELGDQADTADGILLLALAERIDAGAETSPALATLSKEYAARKAALTELRTPAANPHDELRAMRERRRAG